MLNFFLANRNLAQTYQQELIKKLDNLVRPEEFAPAGNIDPQAFYLEFKKRVLTLVNRETEKLKNDVHHNDNCHLILLKHTVLVDVIIENSFKTALWFYNRNHLTTLREQDILIAIVACGGYGREEMYFQLDVDVQIVSKANEKCICFIGQKS